jgi:hypothetical protein
LGGLEIRRRRTAGNNAEIRGSDRRRLRRVISAGRIDQNPVEHHPVTPEETITKNSNDPKVRFLRDKIFDAVSRLEDLFEDDCDYNKAMRAWNFVFWMK